MVGTRGKSAFDATIIISAAPKTTQNYGKFTIPIGPWAAKSRAMAAIVALHAASCSTISTLW